MRRCAPRYVEGQRFGRHFDDSVDLGAGRVTTFTLLVYLSGGETPSGRGRLVGGETVFYGAHLLPTRALLVLCSLPLTDVPEHGYTVSAKKSLVSH